LLHRHPIARAHRLVMMLAAIADADTAQRRAAEHAGVLRILEERHRLTWRERVAEPQVLRGQVRIDDLARVHPALRIEDRLELAEPLNELRAAHLRQELGLRLAAA